MTRVATSEASDVMLVDWDSIKTGDVELTWGFQGPGDIAPLLAQIRKDIAEINDKEAA